MWTKGMTGVDSFVMAGLDALELENNKQKEGEKLLDT